MSKSAFHQAADAWYAVSEKYASLGASDTEPRGEFAQIVIDIATGDLATIPLDADSWQLFHDMKGAKKAAAALSKAAEKVVQLGYADRDAARAYAKYQGWYY